MSKDLNSPNIQDDSSTPANDPKIPKDSSPILPTQESTSGAIYSENFKIHFDLGGDKSDSSNDNS